MINRLIKNEEDYKKALSRIEELMDARSPIRLKWMSWN